MMHLSGLLAGSLTVLALFFLAAVPLVVANVAQGRGEVGEGVLLAAFLALSLAAWRAARRWSALERRIAAAG